MNSSSDSPRPAKTPSAGIAPITLQLRGFHCPSFKNTKRAILDSNTNQFRTLTPGKIKKRMQALENAIVSALYSASQIVGNETHSECLKRLRTVCSDLLDDSVKEIPAGEWDTVYVLPGEEGLDITIEIL